jgi:hypothetical protein
VIGSPLRCGRTLLCRLLRATYEDVESFRIDAILFAGEIVLCSGPLQRPPEIFLQAIAHSLLNGSYSKIRLELIDPVRSFCASFRTRERRSRDLPNFQQHRLGKDAGHRYSLAPGSLWGIGS